MSERRRAGKAPARKRRNLSANARRMASAMRKRGFSPEDVVASQPPRRRRPGPITSPGGGLPVNPIQKPMPRRKPGRIVGKPVPPPGGGLPVNPIQKPMPRRKFVGEPVTPPGGKLPVPPRKFVGEPVTPPGGKLPVPPKPGTGVMEGGAANMNRQVPKMPGGFKKGGGVKGKAKIRGAGIERKGLRKAKIR